MCVCVCGKVRVVPGGEMRVVWEVWYVAVYGPCKILVWVPARRKGLAPRLKFIDSHLHLSLQRQFRS